MVWIFFSKAKDHYISNQLNKTNMNKNPKFKSETKETKGIFKIISHVSVENNSIMSFQKTKNEEKTNFSA